MRKYFIYFIRNQKREKNYQQNAKTCSQETFAVQLRDCMVTNGDYMVSRLSYEYFPAAIT